MGKVNASIYKLALFLGVLLAYVIVNDVHVGFWVDTPHASITATVDSTPGKDIFNPNAKLDTSQIDYEVGDDNGAPYVAVQDNENGTLQLSLNNEDETGELWDALIRMGYRGHNEGCECLTVADGIQVDAPTYSYTIAHDGIRVEGQTNADK